MSSNSIFSGCIPALMTPCDAAGVPDFDALAQKGRELVDAGMRAVVYCGSMGDCRAAPRQRRNAPIFPPCSAPRRGCPP